MFLINFSFFSIVPFDLVTCPLQYEEYGEEFVDMLDGMFSFVLLDTHDKSFIAARDAIGITPLYMGWGLDGMQVFFIHFMVSFGTCKLNLIFVYAICSFILLYQWYLHFWVIKLSSCSDEYLLDMSYFISLFSNVISDCDIDFSSVSVASYCVKSSCFQLALSVVELNFLL